MAGAYLGVFCPSCGHKLQEEYRRMERLGICIKRHAWRVTATVEGYRLEEIRQHAEESKEQEGVSYRARAW